MRKLASIQSVVGTAAIEGADAIELAFVLGWQVVVKKDEFKTGDLVVFYEIDSFLPASDSRYETFKERFQNYGAMVERALDEEFEATVKKDGSSLTVFVVQPDSKYFTIAKEFEAKKVKGLFSKVKIWFSNLFAEKSIITGICSRNIMLAKEDDSNFHKAVDKYNLLEKLKSSGKSYALQGELVAPDIQGNYEKVQDIEFHLFDVFDIDNQQYLLPLERKAFADKYDIPHVTVIGYNTLNILTMNSKGDNIVQKCLDFAEGRGDNAGVMREGVVFKSMSRDFSFKSISNSYLLKQK